MLCKQDWPSIRRLGMLGETDRWVMGPIRGSGDFLAYGSPSISAECLCGKATPGWSGIMLLRRQWLPPPLPPYCYPPPPPLTLPHHTRLSRDGAWLMTAPFCPPGKLPVFPLAAAATAIAAVTASAALASAVKVCCF
jgi:hypothetical protein